MDEDWEVTKIGASAKYYRIIKEDTDYFLKSDSVQMTGSFKDYAQTIKEGEFVYYNEQGHITIRSNHKNGKFHGLYSSYYPTGELHYTENYENDRLQGDFIVYYENGAVRRKETYLDGKVKFKACYLENGKKTKYFQFAIPAAAKGGSEAVKKYIVRNLYYPDEAVDKKIEGKVYIKFLVSKTGDITDVTVKKSSGYAILDEEAVRIIKEMPKWSPAHLDGEIVESNFSIPISFKLN
jgi:TonB family protein